MIEKLDSKMDCVEITVLGKHTECLGFDSAKEIGKKLNELVDAVNELQESQNTYWTDIAEIKKELQTRPENVQDVFAEQRKWIGKLCKFWDIDNNNLYYGPLTKIYDTSPYCYECNHKMCYAFCEPVKDDIIYKGE